MRLVKTATAFALRPGRCNQGGAFAEDSAALHGHRAAAPTLDQHGRVACALPRRAISNLDVDVSFKGVAPIPIGAKCLPKRRQPAEQLQLVRWAGHGLASVAVPCLSF